ncbi:Lactoylglutathione lyase [Puccinia graminis f. sp. tritici]|uniref:Lactoylglutathione lyase n=1 Tax=Puccinia graminis f. sp. tritici TaxID=56615 RepID=A0A5B0MMG4_PUCGR|nr:Lactoylglutathione lyase [Puccinia graminis f. sp. tritici]
MTSRNDGEDDLKNYLKDTHTTLTHKQAWGPHNPTQTTCPKSLPNKPSRLNHTMFRIKVVELCRNWGTKSDPHFSGYHNGNESKPGYGHIAITSDDVEKTWSLSSRILMAIGSLWGEV